MDIRKQVTLWVEQKFGSLIAKDIKNKIQKENSSFEIESIVDNLFNLIVKGKNAEKIKMEILNNHQEGNLSRSDSGLSKEEISFSNSLDSLVLEQNDFANFSITELVNDLKNSNEDVRFKSLKTLEVIAEDLINQTSWQTIRKVLQILLEQKINRKHQILILKIFLKFMTCPSKPQMVCESFIIVTEVVSYHIDLINASDEKIFYEEIYDFKDNKWLYKKVSQPKKSINGPLNKSQRSLNNEVLIKSMWLLLECQKQMPEKWIRFHEKRLKEIVFSFVYMLASTSNSQPGKVSGLEVLSILNPSATWCRHWCHTALGRGLLCSAFRKYKNFFIHMVEVVLTHIRMLGHRLEPILKGIPENRKSKFSSMENLNEERVKPHSAPEPQEKESFLDVKNSDLPRKIIKQATFCHCLSLLVFLIQFRSGRALFPIQTSLKKRSVTIQDFIQSVTSFLKNSEYETTEVSLTQEGKRVFLQLLQIIRNVSVTIQSSRRSAERPPTTLTYFSSHI